VTQLTLENTKLREQVRMLSTEADTKQAMLESAAEDALRLAQVCEDPAQVRQDAHLYREGILNSTVFKTETFKKFLVSTMNYTNRVEASNSEVKAVMEGVRVRLAEAHASRTRSVVPPPQGAPKPTPLQVPAPGAGPSEARTPQDKGKEVVEEGRIPPRTSDSPARNTRSTVRNLAAEDWAKSPASKKLHEIGLEKSEEDVLPDSPESDECEMVEGKRLKKMRSSTQRGKRARTGKK
jgi:hypothetical protein